MIPNIKRIIFQVDSKMNHAIIDDSPIQVGCELVIPDKFKVKQPLCIISHGSGGLGADTDLFVNSLANLGIASLCVDSFTGRNIDALHWGDILSSYVSPKMRALETVEAYNFLKNKNFPYLDLDNVACVGFSWGADTIANITGYYFNQLPKDTFYALCYGNLWPFEEAFYNAKDLNVRLYHGEKDNWTSPDKSKIFAEQTDSEYVEFYDCVHGFCKPANGLNDVGQVTINHHAPFPIPTELTDVYKWIMKGKIWKDTDFQKVNAVMEYDDLATQRIISDIYKHLLT